MKCPHCGKEHPTDFKVCPYTAKPIEPQFQYCKNEGCDFRSPLPLSAKFCPNCSMSLHQKEVDEYRFDEIHAFHEGFAVVKKDNLYGLISSNGDLKLECAYKEILPFSEGLCGICDKSGQWFFINHTLERMLMLSSEYYVTSDKGFCSGLCAVFKWDDDIEDYLFGYVDRNGREVILCSYSFADDFVDGYAVVEDGSQFVINRFQKKITNGWDQIRIYQTYGICNDFRTRDYTEIVNLNSGDIVPLGRGLSVHVIGELKDDMCCYFKKDKLVWFDINTPSKRQNFKQPVKTCWCDFNQGLMSVKLKNGRYGFIDQRGNIVIQFIYDEAHNFCEGLAAVCQEDKWCYINEDGVVIINGDYDSASDFSEGLAVVTKNGKPFVVDKTGTVVIR